jgi:hypothetical protein
MCRPHMRWLRLSSGIYRKTGCLGYMMMSTYDYLRHLLYTSCLKAASCLTVSSLISCASYAFSAPSSLSPSTRSRLGPPSLASLSSLSSSSRSSCAERSSCSLFFLSLASRPIFSLSNLSFTRSLSASISANARFLRAASDSWAARMVAEAVL